MKSIALLLTLLYNFAAFAQNDLYPCKFKIVDARTNNPVEKALVTVVQAGLKTIESDVNGFCDFKAIPVGRIDVNVSHQDYRHLKLQHNISSEVKNNSFVIELVSNSESNLLVSGQVENGVGAGVSGVSVEVKVDGQPFKTYTDESGNYQLDISLKTSRSDRLQLEFRKDNCKYVEEVSIPEKRYILKNVTLSCASAGGGSIRPINTVNMQGQWEVTIRDTNECCTIGNMYFVPSTGHLKLTQQGDLISGSYRDRYSGNFSFGEVYGKILTDSIRLEITCTEGFCKGSGWVLIGWLQNNIVNWRMESMGNEPDQYCNLNLGPVSLRKRKLIELFN